jgi:hypothetical protein
MKKCLLLLLLSVSVCFAAEMGKFDAVSQNYLVNTGSFSCTFLQGCMFPTDITLADGTPVGAIIFRDAVTGSDKKVYTLLDERWADTKIIRNDDKEFIIEREGAFMRNVSPLITKLQGVKITCRYTFRKNSNRIGIKFIYRKNADVKCCINNSITPAWYYSYPFDRIIFKGKAEAFQLQSGKKHRFWDSSKPITLTGKNVFFRLTGKRVIARLLPGDINPCMLNGGFWQHNWQEGNLLEKEAVMEFGSVRNGTLQE